MTGAGREVVASLSTALGGVSEGPALAALFAAVLIVAPFVLLGGAAAAARALAADRQRSVAQIAVNFSYALVPFGFGMWLAHYGFHLLTGALAIVPVAQRAVALAFGSPVLGDPLWTLTGMRPGSVFPIQVGFVLLGSMGSCAASFRFAERDYLARAGRAVAPWALLVTGLAALALWMFAQPMDMRGLGFAG